MARIPVDNLGSIGFVGDIVPQDLPPEAWTYARNVRMMEGGVKKMEGEVEVYKTPTIAPYGLFPVATATAYLWAYMSLTKAHAIDAAWTPADITRVSGGDYAATVDIGWTGGAWNGVGVFNNGVDTPQAWIAPATSVALIALANWPSGYTAMSLRGYKNYLVAMDITKSGTRYPKTILWSHEAQDPGTVPSSWDITDETLDAGEADLGDTNGAVVDSLVLLRVNVIYKEDEVWLMNYVGGTDVMDFRKVDGDGILSRNCAAIYKQDGFKHAVFGPDDLYVHNGVSAKSIADAKTRRYLFNRISSNYFRRCFTVANPAKSEIWFCYVPVGEQFATKALVWNYRYGQFCGERDLPGIRTAALGLVAETSSADLWAGDAVAWNDDVTVWDAARDARKRTILLADTTNTKFKQADRTNQFAGVNMTSCVKRSGIALIGRDREGRPKADTKVVKLLLEVWPRIEAPDGTVFTLYVGVHDKPARSAADLAPDDMITWSDAFTFTVGTDEFITPLVSGRYLAIWCQTASNVDWKLMGYDLEIAGTGALCAPV